MSTMLALMDAGWLSVLAAVKQGRRTDALTRLKRLLARPDMPIPVAADAHRLAGELLTDAERYSDARRHLRAAAALEPEHARTFYLLGVADESDPLGSDHRAAMRFRTASRLDASNGLFRAAFGRAAIRCGGLKLGVSELLAAIDAAPGEVAVIRVAIDGLLEANRPALARRLLNTTGFLCRDAAKARELRALGERVRFEAARRDQRAERGTTRQRQDAEFARDGGRVVLPFVRVASGFGPGGANHVRRDVLSLPRPHFPRLRSRKADR